MLRFPYHQKSKKFVVFELIRFEIHITRVFNQKYLSYIETTLIFPV